MLFDRSSTILDFQARCYFRPFETLAGFLPYRKADTIADATPTPDPGFLPRRLFRLRVSEQVASTPPVLVPVR